MKVVYNKIKKDYKLCAYAYKMFTCIRLHSQLLRNLNEEITDSFIESINYPNDLRIYLEPLELCLKDKITCSGEIIKGLINLSDFLLIDLPIHKKLLDYKDNITIVVKNKEFYINDLDFIKSVIDYIKKDGDYSSTIKYFIDKSSYVGLIDVLKFIRGNFKTSDFCYRDSISYAAKNGQIETIKFLKEEYNASIDSMAITNAASKGQIETIKFLKEKYNAPIDHWAITNAAYNEQIETIKFLKEKYNAPINMLAVEYAVYKGHIETIKFLKENYIENVPTYTIINRRYIEEYNAHINSNTIQDSKSTFRLNCILM